MSRYQLVHRYRQNAAGREFVGDLHGCFSMLEHRSIVAERCRQAARETFIGLALVAARSRESRRPILRSAGAGRH